jgi:hypothetical protein
MDNWQVTAPVFAQNPAAKFLTDH